MAPTLQISIPTTSTSLDPNTSKPYTLYHIQLQLPLRTLELRKRYTDFSNLHSALTAETSAAPPAPLPPKAWLRRTVNNESLTETRRQALATYLQAILEAKDARWRSSAAWRGFLNLPGISGGSAGGAAAGKEGAARPSGGDGGIQDSKEWLEVHRELKTQIQSARSQLKQRDNAETAMKMHGLSAEAKTSLVRAAASIAQLEDGLRTAAAAAKGDEGGWGAGMKLGPGELRRRRDMVSAAKSEVEGLESVLKTATRPKEALQTSESSTPASASDRQALFNGSATASARPAGRVLGGPAKETERTRELDNTGVLQLQQQILQDQDEDILELGKTVARLKDMGIMIGEELEVQNEMLDHIDQDADRVQGKIDVAKRRIKTIS